MYKYMSYDRFIDERLLTSRDALNKLQIKMKVLEIDESARDFSQRFGRRALVQKVLLTIKYNDTEEVEERELDVEEIEKRIKKERLFSSSNRWLASSDIKNGYVVAKPRSLTCSLTPLRSIYFRYDHISKLEF